MSNYIYLGHGAGRAVAKLIGQDVVVKVPYNTYGTKQNDSEFEAYNKGDNPYLAKIIDYKDNRLYMEQVEDCSNIFRYYERDKIWCEEYDDKANINYTCNADCFNCPHNILTAMLPKNIDKILKYKNPNDTIQIGKNKKGEYKYYDYGDCKIGDDNDGYFVNGDETLFIEYLENNETMPLKDYLVLKRGEIKHEPPRRTPPIRYERMAREKWVAYMNRGNK